MNKITLPNIYNFILSRIQYYYFPKFLFYVFGLLPLKNKVVATTMRGRKYADNPRYILEKIHRLYPRLDMVWLKNSRYDYQLPSYIREVSYTSFIAKIYELATAKVWINSHRIEGYYRKRKKQLFIETWHGGLAIKKLELDLPRIKKSKWELREIRAMCDLADVFVSNSDFLSSIYRNAMGYKGDILKCGYPRNDVFFVDNTKVIENVKTLFGLNGKKCCLYAPTFRDDYEHNGLFDSSLFDIDVPRIKETLNMRFGGEWEVLIKWHPILTLYIKKQHITIPEAIDATEYQNMQELLLTADVVISDYSSCLFDAALREIPCFTYAKDFDRYREGRGVYFEMEELPFPYARNNDELISNILLFNHNDYIERWKQFAKRTGLHETGHATEDIANKVLDILNGKKVVWE